MRDDDVLPVESHLASFEGATGWLNSDPLTPTGLRGKVVAVDFCTYTCINWLRTLPYVRAWWERYGDLGLTVIGVHTPEFSFEHDVDNIGRALQEMRVEYPIAIDSNYGVWNSFANHYWPALYIADAEGRIRHHWFGEGDYEGSERAIRTLLREAGAPLPDGDVVSVRGAGAEAEADWETLRSPETYVGYERGQNFSSPGGSVPDQPHTYAAPDRLGVNEWALSGEWTLGAESALVESSGARLAFRFHARDLHLIMGPAEPGAEVKFRVLLDGEPPGDAAGSDLDPSGSAALDFPRMYQVIRQPGPIGPRLFEIEFEAPGARAFCFTFG